jgi:hypothetical protein
MHTTPERSLALHTRELPRWILDVLATTPAEGAGVHQWLYRAACALKPWRDDENIKALLSATTHCVRRNLQREIREAIRNAKSDWQPGTPQHTQQINPPASWPKRNDELIEAILSEGYGEGDLWEGSPQRFEDESESNTQEILALLFPGDPLLCMGKDVRVFTTRPREEWHRVKGPLQFIVPSPMSAREGVTQTGKPSPKTNNNTGPRRFLVIEFDFKPEASTTDAHLAKIGARHGLLHTRDLCACLLHHLAAFAPLVLVVWSGGKSLQGWFPTIGASEEGIRRLFGYACLIGADRATWTPSQFIRLPYGQRDNGKIQMPIYFNPFLLPQ